MAKKTGYIHLHLSGSIQILSKSQYRIDISNAGITSKLPLTGSIEKLGSKTIRFQYDDTKVSIDDMLITYQVKAGSNTGFSLAQGSLKASNIGSIDSLGKNSNSIYIKSTIALTESNEKMERRIRIGACDHKDGAIQVAQYIVDEIQTNVNSSVAHRMRYHLTGELSNQLKRVFDKADASIMQISNKTGQPIAGANHRNRSKITAAELWIGQVNTEKPWDHKNKIRKKFKTVAVHRPLPSDQWSETFYHKYKEYDYYIDIWSNIHYGYVGRSVGFTANELLTGSNIAQYVSNAVQREISGDTTDDKTAIKIGIELYEKHNLSKDITASIILRKITSQTNSEIPVSKVNHYCSR